MYLQYQHHFKSFEVRLVHLLGTYCHWNVVVRTWNLRSTLPRVLDRAIIRCSLLWSCGRFVLAE